MNDATDKEWLSFKRFMAGLAIHLLAFVILVGCVGFLQIRIDGLEQHQEELFRLRAEQDNALQLQILELEKKLQSSTAHKECTCAPQQ